jgi:hypothetical protein
MLHRSPIQGNVTLADDRRDMLMFKRRRQPPEEDLWGPHFNFRRVPLAADSVELDRLVLRLQALSDVRAPAFQLEHARAIVAGIETEIGNTLESPTKHRDWREARPRVLELLTQLGQILYQQVPPSSD